jgi:hypothetical protein
MKGTAAMRTYDELANAECFGSIALNDGAEVVFYINEFRGRRYAQIRKFIATEDYTGRTRQGMVISLEIFPDLIETVKQVDPTKDVTAPRELARFRRNEQTELVVQLTHRNQKGGGIVLDLREYKTSHQYTGWTKQGVRFDLSSLAEVVDYLEAMYDRYCELENTAPATVPVVRETRSTNLNDPLVTEVVKKILPHGAPSFPDDFLDPAAKLGEFKEVKLPEAPMRLRSPVQRQELVTDGNFHYHASSPQEARFLLYAQKAGKRTVQVPKKPVVVAKCIGNYETFLRELKEKLYLAYFDKTHNKPRAERLTRETFRVLRLPMMEEQ